MKTVAIRYYSKTGNTEKLAEAASEVTKVKAETIDVPLTQPVDILFLGSSVYGGKPDPKIHDFIEKLDPKLVKKVVGFSTAGFGGTTYRAVASLLADRGIAMQASDFQCYGSFLFFHKGCPNEEDLEKFKKFVEVQVH